VASFLYRLGRLAYRRRWAFVAAWLAALLTIGLSAGAFMGTLSNTFSIPGTETQRTLDKLRDEMPALAGGTGSVVYTTADGKPFTATQRRAVQKALTGLEGLDDVRSVTDPFALQDDLDAAPARLADARKQLDDGRARLVDGRARLAAGKERLSYGRTRIADGRARLAEAEAQVESGRARLADAADRLAAGRQRVVAGEARLADGDARLAAAERTIREKRAELADGRRQYDAGRARLLSSLGVDTLAQAEQALDRSDSRLDEAQAAFDDLNAQQAALDADQSMDPASRALAQYRIDEGYRRLAAALGVETKEQIAPAIQQGRAQVAQGRQGLAELREAKARLDAGERRLVQAARTVAAKQRELAAGRAELADARRQVAAGAARLAAGESDLAAGEQRLAAGDARLDAGARTLRTRSAQIPQAERRLADARQKLTDGEEQLALGERRAASTRGLRFVADDGTTAAANVTFVGQTDALTPEARERIQEVAGAPADQGVEVYYSKEIVQDLNSIFGVAEIIGLAVAAVVLLVMLGTLVAAGLPLLMAVLGVAAGVGVTMAFSGLIEMASITPALALMLGLAVGIDYALFIVHRHRRQVLAGMDLEESVGRAIGTSGNAVVFAGLTVVIALAGLAVPGLPFLTVLGLSAAFTVAVAVVMALTLTPALLGFIGRRVASKRAWRRAAVAATAPDDATAATARPRGWGVVVTRHPVLATIASVVLLGVVAVPAASLRTALPDGAAEPPGSSAKQAYELISDRFGGGYNGPVLVVADLPSGLDEDGAERANLDVADAIRGVDGVRAAVPVRVNQDHTVGVVQVVPEEGPASVGTERLVDALRADKAAVKAETGADIALTGQVAAQIDVSAKLADALPPYLAIVVGLSLVLMLLVFRSVVVPLVATAGFLLSLVAAFGATVAVYQWGWLSAVFDVTTPGPIMSFLPILLTGILFGLAMDYQVFLVSAMREAHAHGEDARAAVRSGFRHAAPVVTAAALIMGSVFAGFVFSHLSMIRAIGFSLAVGVLLDAFVVRMTLTPAVMHLLGRRAWYLPRWLDRILPDVDVEGSSLAREPEVVRPSREPEPATT
jgi:RND superfamily putative drug exporter